MGTSQTLASQIVGEPKNKPKDSVENSMPKTEVQKKGVREDSVVKKLEKIMGGLDEIKWSLYGFLGLLKDSHVEKQVLKPQFGKNKEDFEKIKKEFEKIDRREIKDPKTIRTFDEIRKLINEIGQLIGELDSLSSKEERVYQKIAIN